MVDGILDVAVFPRMGRLALIGSLLSVMRERRLPQRPVRYKGSRIAIASDAPMAIHADGVIAGALPSDFHCRAGALRVFA
jgi:diacylglycerol kinase family enzyme